ETKLEQIAAKARCEPKLRFTSLAHHITRDRVRKSLSQIPNRSAVGVDGQTGEEAKKSFGRWIEPMLQSVNRRGYRAPNIRRVYIPKPGKPGKPTAQRNDTRSITAGVRISKRLRHSHSPSNFPSGSWIGIIPAAQRALR